MTATRTVAVGFLLLASFCGCAEINQEDPCLGVVCDQPPENECKDNQTLLVYAEVGTCDPGTGACDYRPTDRHCAIECENDRCTGQDSCDGVVCDDPPDDRCRDENTLLEYESEGTCDTETGRCSYQHEEVPCEKGCELGRCVSGYQAWGWVRIVEVNDTYMNAPGGWQQEGVVAWFSAEPHWMWSLEHQLDVACSKVISEGACSLCINEEIDPLECYEPCEWGRQVCTREGDQAVCRDMPSWNVGTVSVAGLNQAVSLKQNESFYYDSGSSPSGSDDMFDPDDSITVQASGGDLSPFSLSATGVAHLEIGTARVEMRRGQPATVSWTGSDSGARVRIILSGGGHYPHAGFTSIHCDVPDSDGRVDIPASLVDEFRARIQPHGIRRTSHITRYTRDVQTPFGHAMELFVGSARNLQLVLL